MTRRLAMLLAVLALAVPSQGELNLKILSVTATSQTFPLPVAAEAIGLCSFGTNHAYYRVFWEGESTGVATTSSNKLPAGTATAPYCISFGKSPTQPAPWKAISIVCDTAETATVHLQYF